MGEQMNSYMGSRINGNESIQSVNEESSQDESAREAAQVIEELQRAQADTLTDDEFDEQI
jgi:hypothetical protein